MIGFLSAKVWASIAAVGVIAALGWFAVHTIEQRALAEERLDQYQTTLEQQNQQIRDYEARLQAHRAKVQEINRELSAWKQKWKDIQDQPIVMEWVNTPLPAPVRERVLELIAPPGGSGTHGGAFIESDAVAYLW